MSSDPAFALLLACVAWPPRPSSGADIRAAADRVEDWDQVQRLVVRHRVARLVAEALDRAGVAPPPSHRRTLMARAERAARRDALMTLETARLQALLDAARIPNLVLKGATLSALAYGQTGLKQSLDIDLLILPEHVRAASGVLEAAGYAREAPTSDLPDDRLDAVVALTREGAFRRRVDGLLVELQWRTDINPTWLAGVDASSATQTAHLEGAPPLRTLAPDLLYAYLCAHGARHGFARLKWLADLGALIARQPPGQIEALHARAEALGVGRASGLSLRLCQRLLRLELPSTLSARLSGDRALAWLEALCLDFMTGGGGAESERRPLNLYRLLVLQILLNDRWDRLAAELKLRWASPRDRLAVPLPAWASFLYPVLRVPLFVARRLGGLRSP